MVAPAASPVAVGSVAPGLILRLSAILRVKPILSKYSTVVSNAAPPAPASVSPAGRLMPRLTSVVGSEAVRNGEICTGTRLVWLSRVIAPVSVPSASVGQPSNARPLPRITPSSTRSCQSAPYASRRALSVCFQACGVVSSWSRAKTAQNSLPKRSGRDPAHCIILIKAAPDVSTEWRSRR